MLDRYDPRNWGITADALLHTAIVLGGAVVGALLVHWIVFAVLGRLARLSSSQFDDSILKYVRTPARWAMIGMAISIAANSDALVGRGWDLAAGFVLPALLGWVAYRAVRGIGEALENQPEFLDDPVAARTQRTRIAILSRTVRVAILIIAAALVLLAIPGVREVGVAMMASAGLAALAVGAAAQPALKSLIAGLQVAMTQPIRIGDLVKIGDQAGRVEEIRMSFVTIRTWDERVMIVPTAHVLDQTFENWSRVNEQLTGPVYLHLDPATDIQPIRAEFDRFVQAHDLWDGRACDLLMTEAYPESVELRLAVSSATIGDLWALRCAVREHMLDWLRREMPDALIRHRLELPGGHPKAPEPAAP